MGQTAFLSARSKGCELGMTDIKSLTVEELTQSLAQLALKPYRAQQIFKWLHEKSVESFDEMLNIPKNVRVKLSEIYYISVASIEKNTFLVMMIQ